jgi:hypothetical protein
MNDVTLESGAGHPGLRFAIALVTVIVGFAGWTALAHASSYYIDCSAATNGTGHSQASPWNNLASPNATTFSGGDTVLLKRGTSCSGSLQPGGSGTSTRFNAIGSYGTGALPIINGGTNTAALKLFDQQYWNISNIEIVGGDPYGIFITGNTAGAVLHGFNIINVDVNNVNGDVTQTIGGSRIGSSGGGIVVAPAGNNETVANVVVDGATVENFHQWSGIRVGNSSFSAPWNGASQALSSNVTIKNSTVHDVWGSGITVFETDTADELSNVVYNVGLEPAATWVFNDTTPNGIWFWYCHNCTTEKNEAYNVQTPWLDGGEFDIDTWSQNATVQYNYGHDSVGYCVGILGTVVATTNSVVRYNICANNGKFDLTNQTYPFGPPGIVGVTSYNTLGDFYMFTWGGGSLNGVGIYNNTSYWNPLDNQPAVYEDAAFSGTNPNYFVNNIIYATSQDLLKTTNTNLGFDYNDWWTTATSPSWIYSWNEYHDFGSYTKTTFQDPHGMFEDPGMNNPTYHSVGKPTTAYTLPSTSPAVDRGTTVGGSATDFFGNTVPQGTAPDIGADESAYSSNNTSGVQAINAGGASTGSFGSDNDYLGGAIYSTTTSIDTSGVSAPAPQAVYQSERWGTFEYIIPNLTANHSYLIRLHESENFWTAAGQRQFNVVANGTQVLTNFDIYAAAGGQYKAVVVQFNVTADSNGKITLQFLPGAADEPKVNGIEVQ